MKISDYHTGKKKELTGTAAPNTSFYPTLFIKGITFLLLVIGCSTSWAQPFPVTVTTNVIPPPNPVISQYVSSGNVRSTLLLNAVGVGNMQVLVFGKIERISPSPFTITTNATFSPQQPINLTTNVPLQLTATDLLGAFAFFNDNNLSVTGIPLADLKDANNNIKLPDGLYRICFYARQFLPAGGQGPLVSDQNLGCGNFTLATQSTGSVLINTRILPPVNPVIGKTIQSNGLISLVNYNNASGGTVQVKLFGKIECISPTPFSVSLNPNYQLQQPVSLVAAQPLQLNASQVLEAFGNFNPANLQSSGIAIESLKDKNNNFRLPDGIYRICIYARYFTANGIGANASDPNLGCTNFTICSKASAPQMTQPVSNFNINSEMVTVQKISPLVFSWTAPSTTCGVNLSSLSYDFELRELLPTQTVTDAINNPPVFTKTQLHSTVFLFDTLLNKEVLKSGKKYVVRVKANTSPVAEVLLDNDGYSRIESFQYGTESSPVSDLPKGGGENSNLPPGVCAGVIAPSNKTDFSGAITDLQDKDLTIGKFKLHTDNTIKKNKDGSYSGDGYVEWTPLVNKIRLRVKFDNIKVNTDKAIYDGQVNTTTEPGSYTWTPVAKANDIAGALKVANDKVYKDVTDFINSKAKMMNQLLGNTPIDLPIGMDNDVEGTHITLAIMAISFSPTGTNMNLMTGINVAEADPKANSWLNLAGTNFCINPIGTVISDGTLYFPNDRDFDLGSGSDKWNFKFKGSGPSDTAKGTYVNIKNGKLDKIMARAEITFPRNLMVPEDADGKVLDDSLVTKIEFRFANWNDWMGTIDMPNFQLADVKGMSFRPTTIYYDHSVKTNPAGFTYPSNAKVKKGNDFEGFYMKEFKIVLPEDFKTFNQKKGERTDFLANNLIIDDQGLSVYVKGTNVIDLSTGNLGGWGFSLKNIELDIASSTFVSGKIDGQLLLPISETALDYSGDMHTVKDSLQYDFIVKPSAKMSWDIWKASVELKPSSYVEVKRDSLGTAVTALMNGDISIILSSGTPALKFEAMRFDSLGISNRNIKTKKKEFWMSKGVWALASPQKSVAGFPVNLDKIVPFVDLSSTLKTGLQMDIYMGIGGADKTVLAASTSIKVYGEASFGLNSEDFRPKFKLTGGVSADSIKLKGDAGPVKINGMLVFYDNNKTYGNGIKGHVEATFPMVKIEATAQFGNINDYDYWFIDACAQFANPIPIVGVVGISGFGGGAYYNMKLVTEPPNSNEMKAKEVANNATPGKSMSGIQFVPDENSFGLRATVLIALTSGAGPKAMNAKVTMGAEMKNGAFQNLNLTGDVYVFTNPPDNDRAIVNGHVEMVYDFPTSTFSMNALIKGKFGTMTATIPIGLHTGPDGWFFKIGDPQADRVSIKLVDIGDEKSIFRFYLGATAYLQMGSLINPSLPDLPAEITTAGLGRSSSVDALINSMNKADGNGLMFGARVDALLKFQAAIFYAKGKAIVGFDMALKNFSDFKCGGQSAGWENWYALGQLYAYLNLEAGVHLDVWFYKGDIPLLGITTGAVLSAGLPNPTWLDGTAKFEGNVLGIIKFSTQTHFTMGDKCYPDPDPLRDIKIISDTGPKGNKESVYTVPYAASNLGLDKTYEIAVPPTNGKENGEIRFFRFRIKSFRLLKNGSLPIESTGLEYRNDNNSVLLKRDKVLDGNTNYTGEVICYAEQYYDGEGWAAPWNDKEGKKLPVEQTETFAFRTGPKPGFLPDEAISFSYPVNKQRFVLKQEFSGKGKIHLVLQDDELLPGDGKGINALRSYKIYLIAVGTKDTITTDFSWNETTKDIEYTLPASLKNSTAYRLEFWSTPKSGMMKQSAVLNELKTQTSISLVNIKGVTAEEKSNKVVASVIKIAKPIYTMYFKTSQFNTLNDKLVAMGEWSANKKNSSLILYNDAMATEHFDDYETKGFNAPNGTWYPGLLDIDIPWDNNHPYDRFVNDNVYANAFMVNLKQVSTDFGVNWIRDYRKPVKTFDLKGLLSDKPLTMAETGEPMPPSNTPKVSTGGGYLMSIPLNNVNKNQSQSFSLGYQSIIWDRDRYIQEDVKLMKDFAYAVSLNANAFYNWSPQKAEAALGAMYGDLIFSNSSLGGMVSMPWNKFFYLYSDPKYMSIINQLKSIQLMSYPKGNRALKFSYRAGNLKSGSVSKSFSY